MDSIENRPLTDTATQEAVEVTTATEVAANSILSKEDVIARLQEINLQEEPADKAELDTLKQTFYRLRNAEVEAARKAFEEEKGDTEGFVTPKDDLVCKGSSRPRDRSQVSHIAGRCFTV